MAGLALFAGGSPVGATTPGATGNAAAIALYRQVQKAYAHVAGVETTRHGFFAYTTSGTNVRWAWGQPPPSGFKAATETVLQVLSGGAVHYYSDVVKAPGLPTLEMIGNSSGNWTILGSEDCYTKFAASSAPVSLGEQFVGVVGNFGPVKHDGSEDLITSAYPWGPGSTATEVDTVSGLTKQILRSTVQIRGRVTLTFTATNRSLAVAVVPAPSPVCTAPTTTTR